LIVVLFLTGQPLWVSGLIVVGFTTVAAMLGPALVRRFVTLERLTTNNEVAGFKFATVGVLYAVLLAFAIIVVWQKYNDADDTVAKEAGAAATLYHLSRGIGDAPGASLRGALTAYLGSAVTEEWPSMEKGNANKSTRQALEAVCTALLAGQSFDRNTALMSEIFYQLDVLTQARRARLVAAEGAVPGVVWMVLFGGAALVITFTLFFGTKNLRVQVLMTGPLSTLIFSELLIIVAIDRPFTGTVKVSPNALQEVLADFGS
jgi:hypothetical protein